MKSKIKPKDIPEHEIPESLVKFKKQIKEGCERAKSSSVLVGQSEPFFSKPFDQAWGGFEGGL